MILYYSKRSKSSLLLFMSLPVHISIHVILSILAGALVFGITKKPLASFTSAFLSGVAVDFDHFIDYFLSFGVRFHWEYFANGYQFLKSNKIYILFHGWEYVVIFLAAAYFVKNKLARAILLGLAMGLFFHLSADCLLNEGMKPQAYSIIYRVGNNFDIEKLVTPEHYEKHIGWRKTANFE